MQSENNTNVSSIIQRYQTIRNDEKTRRLQFFRGRTILYINGDHCEIRYINIFKKIFKKFYKPQEDRIMFVLSMLNKDIRQLKQLPSGFTENSQVQRFQEIWKRNHGVGQLFSKKYSEPTQFGRETAKKPGPFLIKLRSRPLFEQAEGGYEIKLLKNHASECEKARLGDALLLELTTLNEEEELTPLDLKTMSTLMFERVGVNLRNNKKWFDEYLPKLSPPALKVFAHLALYFPLQELLWEGMTLGNVFRVLKEKISDEGRAAFISVIPICKPKPELLNHLSPWYNQFLLSELTRNLKMSDLLVEDFELCQEVVADLPSPIQESFYSNLLGLAAVFLDSSESNPRINNFEKSMKIVETLSKVPGEFRAAVLEKMFLTDRWEIFYALLFHTEGNERERVQTHLESMVQRDLIPEHVVNNLMHYFSTHEIDEKQFELFSTSLRQLTSARLWERWVKAFSTHENYACHLANIERNALERFLRSGHPHEFKVRLLRSYLKGFNMCGSKREVVITSSQLLQGVGPLLVKENRDVWLALAELSFDQLALEELAAIYRAIGFNPLLIDLINKGILKEQHLNRTEEERATLASIFGSLSDYAQDNLIYNDRLLLDVLLNEREKYKDNPIVTRKIFTACLKQKPTVLDSFEDQVWEDAFEELHGASLVFIWNQFTFLHPLKYIEIHPQRERSILRGLLKNKHKAFWERTTIQYIQLHFKGKNPLDVVRWLGVDSLLNFPWMMHNIDIENFPSYLKIVLPQLDMNKEEDKTILSKMARSPLCEQDNTFVTAFLHRITAEQQKQIEPEDVHPVLLRHWMLSTFPAEQLYKYLPEYDEGILHAYRNIKHIHFDRVFAVACKEADEEADLPELIIKIAKTYFEEPSCLGRLENPAHILRVGRLMGDAYKSYSISNFMRLFLTDSWTDEFGLPIERIRALQQLIAEKSIVFQSEPSFDFREMVNVRHRKIHEIVTELAEKMDDPFLLVPLLCTDGAAKHVAGPLSAANRDLMIKDPVFYERLMKIFEKAPWKLALLLEVNSPFDVETFIDWEKRQGEETGFPNLRALRVILEDEKMRKNKHDVDSTLDAALINHQYGQVAEQLNQYPQLASIFSAPIVGPSAQTVDQQLGCYTQKQLLAALSTPEGIEKLKPFQMSLLNDSRFSVEFISWMAQIFGITDVPLFRHVEGAKENNEALFNNPDANPKPDITLKIGDTSFLVHSEILNANSTFFTTFLSNGFAKPENPDVIELRDIELDSIEAVESVLRYMYSGVLPEFVDFDSRLAFFTAFDFLK